MGRESRFSGQAIRSGHQHQRQYMLCRTRSDGCCQNPRRVSLAVLRYGCGTPAGRRCHFDRPHQLRPVRYGLYQRKLGIWPRTQCPRPGADSWRFIRRSGRVGTVRYVHRGTGNRHRRLGASTCRFLWSLGLQTHLWPHFQAWTTGVRLFFRSGRRAGTQPVRYFPAAGGDARSRRFRQHGAGFAR